MTKRAKTPFLFRRPGEITPEQRWMRKNFVRLKKCSEHKWEQVLVAPEKSGVPRSVLNGNSGQVVFLCSQCKGIAWQRDVFWYMEGLTHGKDAECDHDFVEVSPGFRTRRDSTGVEIPYSSCVKCGKMKE